MNHNGHFLGQTLLQHTQVGSLFVLSNQSVDFVLVERCEDLDIAFGILIADIQPELVELIRRSIPRIEPDVSRLRLAELAAIGLRDERTGQGEHFPSVRTANQFSTGRNVSPLVGTAHLQLAVLGLVEVEKVIALQQLVGELRERKSVACLSVQTFLYGILGHHVVDGNVLADGTGKIEEREILHPVVVVDEFRPIRCIAFEIKELAQLLFDTLLVMSQRFFIE